MLPRWSLITGHWYKGEGRNANVAMWDGQYFMTFGNKFGRYVVKQEPYWDDGGPFRPEEEIVE